MRAELGVPAERLHVTGNLKYDLEPDERPLEWAPTVTLAAAGRPILVAGSTMEGEEALLLDARRDRSSGGASLTAVLGRRWRW